MVPHFKRLSDFILAKRWYMRAVYMPGPERDDLAARMYRHGYPNPSADGFRPGFSGAQVPYKDSHKFDIRLTSRTHKP